VNQSVIENVDAERWEQIKNRVYEADRSSTMVGQNAVHGRAIRAQYDREAHRVTLSSDTIHAQTPAQFCGLSS
jgi:hypothetical protein